MPLSRDQLAASIANAARSTWQQLCAEYPGVAFAGFALYSDVGATTLFCSANSPDNFERQSDDDPDNTEEFRWNPPEWDHEDIGSWYFDQVNEALLGAVRAEEPLEDRSVLFDAAVDALESLRDEGQFEAHPDLALVFTLTDDEDRQRDVEWISRLNESDAAADFAEWLEG